MYPPTISRHSNIGKQSSSVNIWNDASCFSLEMNFSQRERICEIRGGNAHDRKVEYSQLSKNSFAICECARPSSER
jgi:hypothetical protein